MKYTNSATILFSCAATLAWYYTSLSRLNKRSFYFYLAQTFLWNLKVFNPRPFIEIEVVHSDGLELALRKVHRLSTEKFNSWGITGRYIELLVIILPETSGSYGI